MRVKNKNPHPFKKGPWTKKERNYVRRMTQFDDTHYTEGLANLIEYFGDPAAYNADLTAADRRNKGNRKLLVSQEERLAHQLHGSLNDVLDVIYMLPYLDYATHSRVMTARAYGLELHQGLPQEFRLNKYSLPQYSRRG